MYALCPDCNNIILDSGQTAQITCDRCGTKLVSRTYMMPGSAAQSANTAQGDPWTMPQQPPYQPVQPSSRSMRALAIIFLTFIVIFILNYIVNLAMLGPALIIVIPNILHANMYPSIFLILPIYPFIFLVIDGQGGIIAAVYFLLIVAAIALSAIYFIKKDGLETYDLIRTSLKNRKLPPIRTRNTGFLLVQLFLASLFFTYFFNRIITILFGEPAIPASLGEDAVLWDYLYGLANASVYEELIGRVLLIGLPLLIVHRLAHLEKIPLKKYVLGGGFDINTGAAILIFFSSLLFGLGHLSGWDQWKVVTTFASGLAFGYLFLKKGLYAAILFHFAFDYLGAWSQVFSPGAVVLYAYGLIMLFWFAMGARYFMHYLGELIEYFKGSEIPERTMNIASFCILAVFFMLFFLQ